MHGVQPLPECGVAGGWRRGAGAAPCRRPDGAADRDQNDWMGQRQGSLPHHRSAEDGVRCVWRRYGYAWLSCLCMATCTLWAGRPALNSTSCQLELSSIPVLLSTDAGGTNRQPGTPAGGGGWRVLLVDSEKHDEPKVVKAITRVVPNCDENHAKVRR